MPKNTSRRYVTDAEYAVWLVNGKGKWTFNKPESKPYLRPEFKYSPPSGTKRIHPTQKSTDLIKDLIEIHTNEGDLIFDPFAGSGEISSVAKKLNRNFLTTEIDTGYN